MTQTKKLVEFLKQCDHAYYVVGKPLVDNERYEALVRTLSIVDPLNTYLKKVGSQVPESSKKVGRLVPMGTLAKYNKEEDVRSWWADHVQYGLLISPKYDGFACELEYVDGNLVMGSTRGDGMVGEDITDAAKKVVPLTVPTQITRVRGEFIIPKKNFDILKKNGYTAMRNAVPGIVRSNSEMMQYVEFIAYEFHDGDNDRLNQRSKYHDLFNVEYGYYTDDFDDAVAHREDWIASGRDSFNYEVDGLVLKTNLILEDDMSHPAHQIAWKFKSNREATTLRGVRANMGVSGRFTPVGLFDTVEFQGAKLTNASLGNFRRVTEMMNDEENPLKVGSTVEVSRRGDIIPYIEECIFTPDDSTSLERLEYCPHCEHAIVYKNDEPYCVNDACIKLVNLRLSQYIAGSGVKGIGAGVIAKMQGYLIHELPDIYSLDATKIADLPGLGQSMVEKWQTLQSKEMTSLQFLGCLPFVDVGNALYKKMLAKHTVREVLLELSDEDIKTEFGEGAKVTTFLEQRKVLEDTISILLHYVKLAG